MLQMVQIIKEIINKIQLCLDVVQDDCMKEKNKCKTIIYNLMNTEMK